MSTYLFTLTPQEPYFFGNEKSFAYPGQANGNLNSQYFIKSELVPAQTSLIGTLRYVLLPVKKSNWKYETEDIEKNSEAVGEKGFKYGEKNEFGKIKHISPLFLLKDGKRLVPTPFDHKNGEAKYTPFSNYAELGNDYIYPQEYNSKDGISHSYMCIDGDENDVGKIYEYSDIFESDMRVGINRFKDENGFFKRQYSVLKEGFTFAVYVTLEDIIPPNTVVYMGQGKSLFIANFVEVGDDSEKDFTDKIKGMLRDDIVYCLSDAFVKTDVYAQTKFAITDIKNYRAYTVNGGKITKDSSLYKLISAGSIFIMKDNESLSCLNDENLTVIGYNTILNSEDE